MSSRFLVGRPTDGDLLGMTASKGFWISLGLALLAFAAGVHLVRSGIALFFPAGLWFTCLCNARWRSRILGWVIFTASFISWMTVLGACGMRWRADPDLQTWLFVRALLVYGGIMMGALYTLREARRNET